MILLKVCDVAQRRALLIVTCLIDSLYNPNYGYFSKQAIIFNSGEPFDFQSIRDELEFNHILGQRYTDFEDGLDAKTPDDTRQLWHTPTELFRPYYGEAIARYLVENYKLSYHPFNDLIIYEMGAGNGTLMLNILDYIRDFYPDIYDCTKYKVIEISSALAKLQTSQISRNASSQGHAQHVEIINRSMFDWSTYVPEPCYILALEVIDNFGHDSIRYNPFSDEPLQGNVLIDNAGEFFEFYSGQIDPVAARYLHVRAAACSEPFQHPLSGSRALRQLRARLPLAPNLTVPEYIPTRLMQFFDVLHEYFPYHRLLLSDFHYLPNTIKGFNAPVVQTRYQRRVVPVTTPFVSWCSSMHTGSYSCADSIKVQQGYFDILFPTDFKVMEDIYRAITGNLTRCSTHEDFFRRWSYVEETQTRSGENPLLSWYKNASVMTTI